MLSGRVEMATERQGDERESDDEEEPHRSKRMAPQALHRAPRYTGAVVSGQVAVTRGDVDSHAGLPSHNVNTLKVVSGRGPGSGCDLAS